MFKKDTSTKPAIRKITKKKTTKKINKQESFLFDNEIINMAVKEITPDFVPGARIKVFGVGGAGCNTVNGMVMNGMLGVDFVAVNTDAQALANNLSPSKINIGLTLTKGLGCGANPELGRKSAEESLNEIEKALQDTDMVFVTAGMGGGTGTGAAPVIAQAARDMGILTVGVVTKPFNFEGKKRLENALEGLEKMKQSVDTLIVIPNDKIFNIIDKKTTFKQSFSMVDKILLLGVQGISDLIVKPGDINIDFADIKVIMQNSGTALLGIGYGEGENRAVDAARRAIDNPLIEAHLEGAKNIIFAVTGGDDLTPIEVQDAARVIEEIADPDANIIWGMTFDESYDEEVKITIVATGFPESTQNYIIRGNSTRDTGMLQRKSKGEDFINRAMKNEGVMPSSRPTVAEKPVVEEEDLETPAFLRKKLKK